MWKIKNCASMILCFHYYVDCRCRKRLGIFSQMTKGPTNVYTKFRIDLTLAFWMKNQNIKNEIWKITNCALKTSYFNYYVLCIIWMLKKIGSFLSQWSKDQRTCVPNFVSIKHLLFYSKIKMWKIKNRVM